MKAMRYIAQLMFAFCMFQHAMLCQSIDASSLKGIKEISVVVEGLGNNACGVSKEDVTTSVKFIIGQSAIRLSDTALYHAYVVLSSLEGCTASSVHLYVTAPVTIQGTGVTDYAAFIWNEGGILSGPDQKARILAQIESYCKSMVVDWNSVNHQ
jgi:hypothetical protein